MKYYSKILLAAAVILLTAGTVHCIDVPGDSNSENTGSLLRMEDFAVADPLVDILSGPAVIDQTLVMMSFTLKNAPVYPTQDASTMTGIYIQSYTVTYSGVSPGAVPLKPLADFKVNYYLEPRATLDGTAWPVVTPDTKEEYFIKKGGVVTDQVRYDVKVTFTAENDYGEEVKVSGEYTIYFSDY